MSRVKRSDTKPERIVRSYLHKLGYRFRLHRKDLPGSPDIVLPRFRTVVFVHGCFWHQHKDCKRSNIPKSNTEFWSLKLLNNAKRDKRNIKTLQKAGWNVIVIWGCETTNESVLKKKFNI